MSRNRIRIIFEYITIIFIILESASVYAASMKQVSLITLPAMISLSVLCLMNLNNSRSPLDGKKLCLFSLCFLFNAIILLLNVSDVYKIGLVVHIFLIFPLLIFYFATIPPYKDRMAIMHAGVNVMIVEGLISVFFYLFASVLGIIQPTGSIHVNWGSLGFIPSYYNIYFAGQWMRNCGIFTEAPMHNYVLSTMLLFEVFVNKKFKIWKIVVLMIAIATTTSTTGQLVLVSCLIFILYQKWNHLKGGLKALFFLVLFCACIAGYAFVESTMQLKKETDSYNTRSEFLVQSFDTFLSHPLFGTGYNSNTIGNSNSIATLLADGGLHLFTLYIFPLLLLPIANYLQDKNKNYLFATFIYFGVFCITVVLYQSLTFLVMAIPLSILIRKKQRTTQVDLSK